MISSLHMMLCGCLCVSLLVSKGVQCMQCVCGRERETIEAGDRLIDSVAVVTSALTHSLTFSDNQSFVNVYCEG